MTTLRKTRDLRARFADREPQNHPFDRGESAEKGQASC